MSRPDFKDIDRAFDRAAALARCSKMDEAELFEHIKDHLHEAGKFWAEKDPQGALSEFHFARRYLSEFIARGEDWMLQRQFNQRERGEESEP